MRRFVHSFWTKPCDDDNEKLMYLMLHFAASVSYIKELGYPIVLHTDSKGKELFKDFPYDEIYTTLDNIPENVNPKFYAYGKFLAMQLEDLGSVHIDGDVFIKSKNLAEEILYFKDDGIALSIEERAIPMYYNKDTFNFIKDIFKEKYNFDLSVANRAYNCGIIGFNSKELKDKYFSSYFEFVNLLNTIQFTENIVPDLICEQLFLYSLNSNLYTVFGVDPNFKDFIDKNYMHIIGAYKCLDISKECIKELVLLLNINLYNKICQK